VNLFSDGNSHIHGRFGGLVGRAFAPSVGGVRILGRVKSKTENLAPAASLVSVFTIKDLE